MHEVPTSPIAIVRLMRRLVGSPARAGAAALACALLAGCGGGSQGQGQGERVRRSAERSPLQLVSDARPACFGAAARDPEHPCTNDELRLTVVPAPLDARDELNAPCRHFRREHDVNVCDFGVRPPAPSTATIALAGDSHAAHWRAAVDVLAHAKGWYGMSMTRRSCPLSTATRVILEPERTHCLLWNEALPQFLRAHPEIGTLFVGALNSGEVIVPPGRTMFEAQVNGYRNAWKRLPRSVRHIVVIRDTPRMNGDTIACVDRAIVAQERAGLACAVPRADALQADPAVIAARLLRSRRVQVVDLTPALCSERLCFPVIGGALVYKDHHHLTRVLAETLGPPLQRDVERLMDEWGS